MTLCEPFSTTNPHHGGDSATARVVPVSYRGVWICDEKPMKPQLECGLLNKNVLVGLLNHGSIK